MQTIAASIGGIQTAVLHIDGITFTLYGPVDEARLERERRALAHRVVQLK